MIQTNWPDLPAGEIQKVPQKVKWWYLLIGQQFMEMTASSCIMNYSTITIQITLSLSVHIFKYVCALRYFIRIIWRLTWRVSRRVGCSWTGGRRGTRSRGWGWSRWRQGWESHATTAAADMVMVVSWWDRVTADGGGGCWCRWERQLAHQVIRRSWSITGRQGQGWDAGRRWRSRVLGIGGGEGREPRCRWAADGRPHDGNSMTTVMMTGWRKDRHDECCSLFCCQLCPMSLSISTLMIRSRGCWCLMTTKNEKTRIKAGKYRGSRDTSSRKIDIAVTGRNNASGKYCLLLFDSSLRSCHKISFF